MGAKLLPGGNGLVFQALDIFNPFSPTEIDKDYKTGDDMVYSQVLFPWGDDIQSLVVVRRDLETDSVQIDQSSFASKYRSHVGSFDLEILGARHFDENLFGFGISTDVLEALWRLDISFVDVEGGGTEVALVTNVDRSWFVV